MWIKSNIAKCIVKNIIELRNSVKWSQSELARKAGVTSAAIFMIEKGDRVPSLHVLLKLSKAFNVSLADLTGDSIPSSNNKEKIFFRKFGDIQNLSESDQKMIKNIITRINSLTTAKR